MGRLSKAKVDQIQKLRKKGYLQKEVAEMAGVDIKTVRAYDPMRRISKPEVQAIKEPEKSTPDIELYKGLTKLANWVTILSIHLPGKIYCPNCLFPSGLELEKKSKAVILRLLDDGDYRCSECGALFPSPPKLAWRLLVNEVAEDVKRRKFGTAKGKNTG